ncbi:OB-fold domain-containing protein [Frankia sp. CNm7]|uniref:OB-fold domain-containing protein n=1 Tax=Frankia nepalensis TaxID=1836974 RepID=A0A937RAM1_9ACTN|nr:OB-fold domain-containing protein [Frankia nepalensis]MBL7500032.1 OB-fold domain-containing protein [Frankia nepalensis]MBL7511539.1 OB-fold domain-containing protein [Frankia nepalensis]MBL7521003.1 OB-fold domain-containing protein [Frankia nepalensis]MBL7628521.1 OB-fold domain-containing protein [Frankia nepalensis]
MSGPRFDLPTIEAETAPWWDAARRGELLIRRCGDCRKAHLYPRPFCPACWSENVTWERAAGTGTLYTWSEVRANDLPPFKGRVPYIAAIVDLDEGPRLETNIVGVTEAELAIGMPVKVDFQTDDEADLTVPVFRPA